MSPRPTNPRKPERLIQLPSPSQWNEETRKVPVPLWVQAQGMDSLTRRRLLTTDTAAYTQNVVINDDRQFESRRGTDPMGQDGAYPVMQVMEFLRANDKKHTVRFTTRTIELWDNALQFWRSYSLDFHGTDRDFFCWTAWADKLLFSNGVDGLWLFDFRLLTATKVAGAPSARSLTTFGGRVVTSSVADRLYRVQWSVKNDYTDWQGLGSGYEDLFSTPGGQLDEVLGVFPFGDENAWMVRARSIWQMSTSGNESAPFRFSRIVADVGAANRQTIEQFPGGLIFAAIDNVYKLTGQGIEPIGNRIKKELYTGFREWRKFSAAYDLKRQEYRLAKDGHVWRYRVEFGTWTHDLYPWLIKSLARQSAGKASVPVDSLQGTVDALVGTIDDLGDEYYSFTMMFVAQEAWSCFREGNTPQDTLFDGTRIDAEVIIESGVINPDQLAGIELHELHFEYDSEMEQQIFFDYTFDDGDGWTLLSSPLLEPTDGSTIAFSQVGRVGRKIRLRFRSWMLGQLHILGLVPAIVKVQRAMTSPRTTVRFISVTPTSLALSVGQSQQLTVTLRDPQFRIITGKPIVFLSSNTARATVSSTGLVQAIATGTFFITVSSGGSQAVISGIVQPGVIPGVASVLVSPFAITAQQTLTQQFVAVAKDAGNNTLPGKTATWSSSDPSIVSVDANGFATFNQVGVVTVTATIDGISGTAAVTVTAINSIPNVVVVSPNPFALTVGQTQQLTAAVFDQLNNVIPGQAVTWASSDPAIATVSPSGLVTAVSNGSVDISATAGFISGFSTATINSRVATRVTVAPTSFTIDTAQTFQLAVAVYDQNDVLMPSVVVAWTSSDPTAATVSSSGLVTPVAAGSSRITATVGAVSNFCDATISAVVVPPPPPPPLPSAFSSPWDLSTVIYNPIPIDALPAGVAAIAFPSVFLDSRYNRGGVAPTFISDVTLTDSGVPATNTTVLQTAINDAAVANGNSRIKLPLGWVSNELIYKKHTLGSFRTYIESETLPCVEGVRATVGMTAFLPLIRCSVNLNKAVRPGDAGADGYYFSGLVFGVAPGVTTCRNLIYNDFDTAQTSAASAPQDIWYNRCWAQGVAGVTGNAWVMNCMNSGVVDCGGDNFWIAGVETHMIISYNTTGNLKFVNNKLDGASISILIGGADPLISGAVPTNFEIRRNRMTRPPTWNKNDPAVWDSVPSRVIKNNMEIKNCIAALIEGNYMENDWSDGQTGSALLLKASNQSGAADFVRCEDIIVRYNHIAKCLSPVSIAAAPEAFNVLNPARKILIEHNVIDQFGAINYGSTNARTFQLSNGSRSRGLQDLVIRNNTIITDAPHSRINQFIIASGVTKGDRFHFINNIIQRGGNYGLLGDGSVVVTVPTEGTNTLNAYFNNYAFVGNVLINPTAISSYPVGNFWAATEIAVGMQDWATRKYTLLSTSAYKNRGTDGHDPGADIATVDLTQATV